jgi:tRNA dimethylallyltransferase
MTKILAIVGPTASGKTEIALSVAQSLNAEIISADSRQIYTGIPIATASPLKEELSKIKHYFIGEKELDELVNAGEYGKAGRDKIAELLSKNKIPIIVGGSGLYIKSLIDGLFEKETENEKIRNDLESRLLNEGKESLFEELKKIDSESANRMDATKFRRVIRALEAYYVTGKKMSDLQKEKMNVEFEAIQIGLNLPREYLYDRINNRVDRMMENGLLEEVKLLLEKGYHYKTQNSLNTVGIKEVIKYLEGELTQDQMITLIKQNTRHYAKRQMTWFRKDKRIKWIKVSENKSIEKFRNEILKEFK